VAVRDFQHNGIAAWTLPVEACAVCPLITNAVVRRRHPVASLVRIAFSALLLAGIVGPIQADEASVSAKELQPLIEKGAAFLRKSQSPDGSWSAKRTGPGATALIVAALLRNGVGPDDPMVAKALAYLESKVQKDGGIYDKFLANYTTSVALMALTEANKDGKYTTVINNATKFLKGLQTAKDEADAKYGGVGYDGKSRPDLSNTQMFIDGLLAAGVPKDDPAIQRALKFISRCQNLPGEQNDLPFAKKATEDDKGGFVYNPLDPDDEKHKTPEGGLRSVGGMTYAGLKSFLYAGVNKDDPRVKAALAWIRKHYTLDENPGMKQAGLYYYYHTFAKAMTALGEPTFEDASGKKHDWKRELFDAIKKRQGADGSWNNAGDKVFGEGDPNIATAFALLSLSYTKK
jgi:squalene-hopene/tetraprenyl-beta-curcumene cyclase